MFNKASFITCVADTLKAKGYGPKKANEAIEYFKRRSTDHEASGSTPGEAAVKSMFDTLAEMQFRVNERAKVTRKNLTLLAEHADRVQEGMTVRTNLFKAFTGVGDDSRGNALGHALISTLEEDKRFTGINVGSTYRVKLKQYWAHMSAVMDDFSKGAFGRTVGVQHHENIVRELYQPGSTRDQAASEIAKAYKSLNSFMVDDFNNSGGSLRKLEDFVMPQRTNEVRIAQSKRAWIDDQLKWNDWTKVRWPDGSPIPPADRENFLEHIWKTKRTDGATDIEPSVGGGQGRALGNMLNKHRVLFYKDADSWLANQAKYGDGSVFDIIAGHIDSMAHHTAIVTHYGQNPRLMSKSFIQQGRKAAGDVATADKATRKDKRAVVDFNTTTRRYEDMLSTVLRENAMNPHSTGAAMILGTSNLLTAALLGSVPLLSQFGDMVTTMATRLSNHTGLIGGLGTYFKGVTVGYHDTVKLAAQTGYAFDEQIMPTFAAERYSGVATYGPAWTKRAGDFALRLSGLNRQTSTLRFTTQKEMMGHMARQVQTEFDKLDNKAVLQHYGITENEWDIVRKRVSLFQPRPNVELLRPLDILDIKHADKEGIFLKFATMIDSESRDAVPAATTEAAVTLRGVTRPDTLRGSLLYSFGMFKNYPLTIFNIYGRRMLAAPNTADRVKFLAALGVGMIAAGAVGVQLRELSHERTPIDMRDPKFWGKAIMASGGLSIWGDFLFGGNAQGADFSSTAAGPLAGLANDMVDVSVGSAFKWIDAMDTASPYGGKWASKLTEFGRRYNPLASNWFLRPILEREVFDQLQRMIDPQGARVRERATVARQKQAYGNDYYVKPGQHLF